MARPIRVEEEQLEHCPDWATSLGSHLPNTRQWTARRGGQLVGGAVLWTGSRHGTVHIEAAGDFDAVGTALLGALVAGVPGELELTVDRDRPMVRETTLSELGFAVVEQVVEVERTLGTLERPGPLLRPLPLAGLERTHQVELVERILGQPGAALLTELEERHAWREPWAVLHRGAEPVAVVLPVWEPPLPGSIAWMGVVPEARGQSLGHEVHRWGLFVLQAIGASAYLDHTELENAAMRSVFVRNGCLERRVLCTWRRAG